MKVSSYDKFMAELTRCGWSYHTISNKVWVSSSSSIEKLKVSGIAYKTTHSNFKGTTIWEEKEGIVLCMVRPIIPNQFSREFRMVAEFSTDGAYIRGNSYNTHTPYVPSNYRNNASVGTTMKEMMVYIQDTSPETLANLKERDIQQAKDKLLESLTKKAEYEAKVDKTIQELLTILACPTSLEGAIKGILQKGLLIFPFHKEYSEKDIEEAMRVLKNETINILESNERI